MEFSLWILPNELTLGPSGYLDGDLPIINLVLHEQFGFQRVMELAFRKAGIRVGKIFSCVDLHNGSLYKFKIPKRCWEYLVCRHSELHFGALGDVFVRRWPLLFILKGV